MNDSDLILNIYPFFKFRGSDLHSTKDDLIFETIARFYYMSDAILFRDITGQDC